jgi:tetratricopeptide (TPR) repeat protein
MKFLKSSFLLLLILLLQSCDLSSGLYKEILDAQQLVKEQSFKEAVDRYKSILNKKPSKNIKIKIYLQLGDIFSIYLNDQDAALRYYDKIIKEIDDPLWQVKVLEKIADINFQYKRDYKRSSKVYRILVDFVPKLNKFDYYEYMLGMSNHNNNKFKDAIKVFSRVIKNKKHKYFLESYYHKGLSYYFLKDWNQAITVWKQYIRFERRKSQVVQVKFLLANAFETVEKLKEAYNLYYSILGDYPNSQVIKNRLKSLYARRVARKR